MDQPVTLTPMAEEIVARIIARLHHEAQGNLPPAVEAYVRQCTWRSLASMENARIMQFVPLLVERDVLTDLRARGVSYDWSASIVGVPQR
jgi:hypothetical protein